MYSITFPFVLLLDVSEFDPKPMLTDVDVLMLTVYTVIGMAVAGIMVVLIIIWYLA